MYIINKKLFMNIQLSIFMTKKERILELLKKENLTSKEIAIKLQFKETETRVYLLRLIKGKKIKSVGKKGRFKVYSIIKKVKSEEKALIQELKFDLAHLYNLMKYKMILRPEINLLPEDEIFLEKIKNKIEKNNFLKQIK